MYLNFGVRYYNMHLYILQWKEMFAERFRIRRNWRKGYCNVRTFEGHTQGACIAFDPLCKLVHGTLLLHV